MRFASGATRHDPLRVQVRRLELSNRQSPFAVILGCSDSRVPAEIIFDQGLGDLFVIRVAGNIVAPSQIGSVEFAAATFGTPLVVVLGHAGCGAVAATLADISGRDHGGSQHVRFIVDRIRPAVEFLVETPGSDEADLLARAVRANVHASVAALQRGSTLISDLVAQQRVTIVGAEYSLDSGVVRLLDG